VRSIAISVSVCLFVCPLAYVKTIRSNFTKFSVHVSPLPVAVARSFSDYNAVRYVLPVLWITSCVHILGQIEIQAIGELFSVTRQMAPGAKSALADCFVDFVVDQFSGPSRTVGPVRLSACPDYNF